MICQAISKENMRLISSITWSLERNLILQKVKIIRLKHQEKRKRNKFKRIFFYLSDLLLNSLTVFAFKGFNLQDEKLFHSNQSGSELREYVQGSKFWILVFVFLNLLEIQNWFDGTGLDTNEGTWQLSLFSGFNLWQLSFRDLISVLSLLSLLFT